VCVCVAGGGGSGTGRFTAASGPGGRHGLDSEALGSLGRLLPTDGKEPEVGILSREQSKGSEQHPGLSRELL
jgi:hypothetical protein